MDSEDKKHLHINIYKDNKKEIDSSSNRSESYLIATNEELNNKVRELLEELAVAKNENETLTDENERMEKSITYQRGLLHNFNGLKKYESDRANLFENKVVIGTDHIKSIMEYNKKQSKYFVNIVINTGIMIMIFSLIGLIDFVSFLVVVFVMINSMLGTRYFSGFNKDNLKVINKKYDDMAFDITTLIKAKNVEITTITSKSDFISDFIDVI